MEKTLVRNGQKVVPTCPECGCRLEEYWPSHFSHFYGGFMRDARGCKCSLYMTFYKVIDGKVYKYKYQDYEDFKRDVAQFG